MSNVTIVLRMHCSVSSCRPKAQLQAHACSSPEAATTDVCIHLSCVLCIEQNWQLMHVLCYRQMFAHVCAVLYVTGTACMLSLHWDKKQSECVLADVYVTPVDSSIHFRLWLEYPHNQAYCEAHSHNTLQASLQHTQEAGLDSGYRCMLCLRCKTSFTVWVWSVVIKKVSSGLVRQAPVSEVCT